MFVVLGSSGGMPLFVAGIRLLSLSVLLNESGNERIVQSWCHSNLMTSTTFASIAIDMSL